MRKRNPRHFAIFWMAFVLLFFALTFAVAFFLTGYFYQIAHLVLPALLVQIINSFLGLLFTALVIAAFSRFFRRQQINTFDPIIQAMERIAKGDFSIRLDDVGEDNFLSNLVASVNKMALELGQMENMRQEFVSNVSHEIQSPLTSIRGFAQALQDDDLRLEDRHHYLEIIETESNRLSRLADDLLKLTSLESEQAKFEPKPYQLDKQIKSIILTCEPQWRAKAIEIDAQLDDVVITADEDLLSQVWMNLLHNSIKFTPRGGSIKVSLHLSDDRVEFSLADTGIGISVEDQVHIFERFYKADKSRTRALGGSGLGLSIVKTIVDMHKGRIDLESDLGKGTTITISLPQGNER